MASPISKLPLNELYERKITPSVEVAIHRLEDFSKISPTYCEKVCRLKCKSTSGVRLLPDDQLDILIIQDHAAPKGKYDRTENNSELVQRSLIDFVCQQAGFQGLRYRVTNLLKCFPKPVDLPKGKSPSVTVLSKCKPYLLNEIERTNPKVIISLSTAVTKALGYKKHSNTGNRGEFVDGRVLITLHPKVLCMIRQNASGKLWGNDYFNIIKNDFKKAAAVVRGELILTSLEMGVNAQKPFIKVCRTLDDIRDMVSTVSSLPEGKIISVDTETNGLDGLADGAKLITMQFGWKDLETKRYVAAVVPLWHRANTMYNPNEAWKLLVPILLSEDIPKVLHNAKFDVLFTYYTTGVRMVGVVFDTMLLAHGLDSGIQGCLSLKTCIADWAPDLNISGYENLLPKLTKVKALDTEEEEQEDEVEDE